MYEEDSFESLPVEVQVHVFEYLSLLDLFRLSSVNKLWRSLLPSLAWKKIFSPVTNKEPSIPEIAIRMRQALVSSINGSFRSQCCTMVDILYHNEDDDARYKVEALLDFLFDKIVLYDSTNRNHRCLEYKLDLDHIRFFALLCKTISDIEIERTEYVLDLTDTSSPRHSLLSHETTHCNSTISCQAYRRGMIKRCQSEFESGLRRLNKLHRKFHTLYQHPDSKLATASPQTSRLSPSALSIMRPRSPSLIRTNIPLSKPSSPPSSAINRVNIEQMFRYKEMLENRLFHCVALMGELFNCGLLTEMTIHTCLFKLLPSIEQIGMLQDDVPELKDYELACAYTFLTVCGEQLDKKSMQSVTRQELMKEHFRRLNFFSFHQPKRFSFAREKQQRKLPSSVSSAPASPSSSASSWIDPSSYNYHFQLGDIYPFSYQKLDVGYKDIGLLNDVQSLIKRRDQWMKHIESEVIAAHSQTVIKSR